MPYQWPDPSLEPFLEPQLHLNGFPFWSSEFDPSSNHFQYLSPSVPAQETVPDGPSAVQCSQEQFFNRPHGYSPQILHTRDLEASSIKL